MNLAAFRGVVNSIPVTDSGENKERTRAEKSRSEMEVCMTEIVLQKHRVDTMLHRLQAASGLVGFPQNREVLSLTSPDAKYRSISWSRCSTNG